MLDADEGEDKSEYQSNTKADRDFTEVDKHNLDSQRYRGGLDVECSKIVLS